MHKIDRRSVLKSGLFGVLMPNLPIWPTDAVAQTIDPEARANFVALSQALTGIPATALDPVVAPDDASMVESYFDVLNTVNSAAFQALLKRYASDSSAGATDPDIAKKYLGENKATLPTDATGTFSRLTVLLWMFGVYYGGTEIALNPIASDGAIPAPYNRDYVVSARAYSEGWIWRIGQTHPMGISRFGYGSWGAPPPSLADYGIPSMVSTKQAFVRQPASPDAVAPARARPQR
jgi:hypothetical protein